MKIETIEKLEKYLEKFDVDLYPNDFNDIVFIEKSLGVKMDEDYKEFLLKFGGCFVGIAVYGVKNCSLLEDVNIVQLTNDFKSDVYGVGNNCYVISMDGSGNPIYFNSHGLILIYDHDVGQEKIFANDFEGMILSAIE